MSSDLLPKGSCARNTSIAYTGQYLQNFSLLLLLTTTLGSEQLIAEGSYQVGLTQRLMDVETTLSANHAPNTEAASLYADVLSAGEVINVSLCGVTASDELTLDIYDPSENLVFSSGTFTANVACDDAMDNPLTIPIRYTTLEPGTFRLELPDLSRCTCRC